MQLLTRHLSQDLSLAVRFAGLPGGKALEAVAKRVPMETVEAAAQATAGGADASSVSEQQSAGARAPAAAAAPPQGAAPPLPVEDVASTQAAQALRSQTAAPPAGGPAANDAAQAEPMETDAVTFTQITL